MHSRPVPANYKLVSDLHQKLGPVLKAWLVRYVVITTIGKRIDQIGCVLAADKFVSPDEIIFRIDLQPDSRKTLRPGNSGPGF
jgi:hypothetical protein